MSCHHANSNNQKNKEQFKYEYLKKSAIKKKEELEKNYGKIKDEVKQTLEVEMNYFTPLIHHLIQKHINQYGKDFPMYFSGYDITKLTQGNDRTALIYAGKDEINIVSKSNFIINGFIYNIVSNNKFEKTPVNEHKIREGLPEYISQQEFEKAYQQATERKAKEIKFEAAKQIGFLSNKYNDTDVKNLIGKESV